MRTRRPAGRSARSRTGPGSGCPLPCQSSPRSRFERRGQLVPDRHADQHAHPRLLGDQRAHGAHALVGVRGSPAAASDLGSWAEPNQSAASQRLVEDRLQLRRGARRRARWASSSRSGSLSASTAASISASVYARRSATRRHHRRPMAARPDLPLPRRRLRLQAVRRRPAPDRSPACRAPTTRACSSPPTPPTTPASSQLTRRPRDRADGRLLHADRRRPVRVRPHRRDQRAVGRLRDGRRARSRRSTSSPSRSRRSGRSVLREILRGGADAARGGRRRDRRRPLDRRPGAEVRAGGHRRRATRDAVLHQRRRRAPATRSC